MNKNIEQVWKLKQDGFSNRQVAIQLGVSHTLINRWLRENPVSTDKKSQIKRKSVVSTSKKYWKPDMETLETGMERDQKKKEITVGVNNIPTSNSTIDKLEIENKPELSKKGNVESQVQSAYANYRYQEYCKEMNAKFIFVLNSLLDFYGKHIAKKRIEDLLTEATTNTFENNFSFNEISASYPHNDLFKKVILTLKNALKQHTHSYQLNLYSSEEDMRKIKEVLYLLEKESLF